MADPTIGSGKIPQSLYPHDRVLLGDLKVELAKGDFVGKPALDSQKAAGIPRRLVGFTVAERAIPPDMQARSSQSGWWDSTAFGAELVRLMTQKGHFAVNTQGVAFRSDTLYSAQLTLRSDVPPGPYLAHTYLFKDGVLVAERSDGFSVRKTGFERFLGLAAVQQPLLYGLACVILALFTGWLGGVVFKR